MYELITLENGLRIVASPMPHTRSVTVSFYVGAGNRYETIPAAGISHFIEHLLFKGTKRYPTAQIISEAIDNVGGLMNAATDRELTTYYIKAAHAHLWLALELLIDMMRRPLFEVEELEKERKVILEELAMVADNPAQLAEVRLDALLWPDGPLGWDIAGTDETVSAISRDQMLTYLARQYVPNNMVLSVAGNFDPDKLASFCHERLDDWPSGDAVPWQPAADGWRGPSLSVLNKKTEQTQIMIATHGPSSRDPSRHAAILLSAILGEGMSSRLFLELRERRALCYDVHSYTSHYLDSGAFTVYVGVDPSNGPAALAAALEELRKVRDGLPQEELAKAKEILKGRLLLGMEDTRSVAGWAGSQLLLHNRIRSVDEVAAEIDAVQVEDVLQLANNLFKTEEFATAIVGPHRSERQFRAALTV